MSVTSDSFLGLVKRRLTIPSNQVLLTDDNILAMANECSQEQMVPTILSVNQNYFVYEPEVIPVEASKTVYSIPYRSIGRGLRDLKVRRGDQENWEASLAMIALEDANQYLNSVFSDCPLYFYFRGDKFVLVPTPQTDDVFELFCYYNMQPNDLIQTTAACYVESVSDNVVTCTNVPSTYMAGTLIDFIQGKSGSTTLAFDVEIQGVSSTQITFNSADDVPVDLVRGDWISLAKTTPVIQLPDEGVPLLVLWTAARVCYAIGDFDGEQRLLSLSKEVKDNFLKIITPRIEGAQTKIINRNGLLRGMRNRGLFGWWNNNF